MSRTEEVLNAVAEALEARDRLQALRKRYRDTNLEAFGELPLAEAAKPLEAAYLEKLDLLRAQLTACGVKV